MSVHSDRSGEFFESSAPHQYRHRNLDALGAPNRRNLNSRVAHELQFCHAGRALTATNSGKRALNGSIEGSQSS
jgi:hypothetical protein